MPRRSATRRRYQRTARSRPFSAIAPRSGVPTYSTSRAYRLPRPYAPAQAGRVMTDFSRATGLPIIRVADSVLRRVQRTRQTLKQRVREGRHAPRIFRNPVIKRSETVCKKRNRRKEVLFALGVAGRPWGRGGPDMRHARRDESSNTTCGG